ncbi:MAG: serine hydrolase domain-containing protein [Saprospiraceae bacterium]
MKIKFVITLLLSACFFLTCTKPEDFAVEKYACGSTLINSHPDSIRFHNFLKEKIAEGLPGITMLIETPEGIWSGAAGVADIPNNIKMQRCNVHRVGSITKTFTASVILMLQEQGLLELNDKISNYLNSEIINKVANADEATIKNLLQHSSGIANYLDIQYTLVYLNDLTKHWTAMEELALIYDEPAIFPVGEMVDYSNTNFLLLGLIAEKITGKTGTQLYREMIFDPLGLEHTFFNQESEIPQELVRGYHDEFGDGQYRDITEITYANNSMAGGISSNVEDLHIYLKACMESGGLFEDSTISNMLAVSNLPFQNPATFEYGEEYKVKKVSGIGLSWFELDTQNGKAYGHDGGFDGRRARMWYFPNTQKSIIYLINASGEKLKPTLRELRRNDMVKLLFE